MRIEQPVLVSPTPDWDHTCVVSSGTGASLTTIEMTVSRINKQMSDVFTLCIFLLLYSQVV